mmetsp:Transcript_6528/g.18295  ORF Transcript_6528/g.18295 Transcript_6528/m.18295 type:complete len:371 (-) Transcript_6528:165-1277(-)
MASFSYLRSAAAPGPLRKSRPASFWSECNAVRSSNNSSRFSTNLSNGWSCSRRASSRDTSASCKARKASVLSLTSSQRGAKAFLTPSGVCNSSHNPSIFALALLVKSPHREQSSARNDASSFSPNSNVTPRSPPCFTASRNSICRASSTPNRCHNLEMSSPSEASLANRAAFSSLRAWRRAWAWSIRADANSAPSTTGASETSSSSFSRAVVDFCRDSRRFLRSASSCVEASKAFRKRRSRAFVKSARPTSAQSASNASPSFSDDALSATHTLWNSSLLDWVAASSLACSSSSFMRPCDSRNLETSKPSGKLPVPSSSTLRASISHSAILAWMSFLKTSRTSTSCASFALKVCVSSSLSLSIWSRRSSPE